MRVWVRACNIIISRNCSIRISVIIIITLWHTEHLDYIEENMMQILVYMTIKSSVIALSLLVLFPFSLKPKRTISSEVVSCGVSRAFLSCVASVTQ